MVGYHEPVNLGNPDEFTMLELVEIIREKFADNLSLVLEPLPLDDPKQRKPVIKTAQNIINWRPLVSLKDGLADF